MKKNMGFMDKLFRLVAAMVFVGIYLTGIATGTFGLVLLVLAGVFVLTTFISFCPLYFPFGASTCDKQ